MPLGEDKAVAIDPFGTLGVMPQVMKVKESQNIGAGKRAARMPGTGDAEHLDDVPADGQSGLRKNFKIGFCVHGFQCIQGADSLPSDLQ